ncbi:hypothetical protein [Hymenobacter koreensis]|uniref:Metal-dependent HD superfamily phosphohydrolase n=1 Tax=Hymenobacter koreensis TaxID=1084523 RepID=A0ABP8IWU2_9BACT
MPASETSFSVENLAARWQQRAASLFPEPEAAEAAWQRIQRDYSGVGRHYHALSHLQAMFAVLDTHPETAAAPDPVVLELAVWFHDIVYQPLRSDNESRSADCARQLLQTTTLTASQHTRLNRLIRRTQHHATTEPDDALDTALLLDADLWVLGASPEAYQQYARQIRQEYLIVPGFLYRPGRRKVLQQLLDAPQLYRTGFAREQREAAARENLAAELAEL